VLPVSGVSFDRVADCYDATRRLPAQAAAEVTAIISAELAGRGRCLEIGVGTGRIALPLTGNGVSLVGADISRPMLDRLLANAGGRQPFPLLLADATRLPLRENSFGAVLASHVLHLIPDWKAAVGEVRRVLRRGGVLLADFGGGAPAPWAAPLRDLLHGRGIFHVRPGVSEPAEVAAFLGSPARLLRPVTFTVRRSLGADIRAWEQQLYSWTWRYTAGQMTEAAEVARAWAARQGMPLTEEIERERQIRWWAFAPAG
jgi:SAM-dependent methyltransferase